MNLNVTNDENNVQENKSTTPTLVEKKNLEENIETNKKSDDTTKHKDDLGKESGRNQSKERSETKRWYKWQFVVVRHILCYEQTVESPMSQCS